MTNLDELQIKLDKVVEYVNNNQYDEAIVELKEGIEKSDCSVCQLELGLIAAEVNYNKDICVLDNELCIAEKNTLIEKIQLLKKDFEEAENMD